MSDEFEDLLKGWLRERGRADRSTLESLAGNVAGLPPRRRRQPSSLVAAAAIIVALGLAAIAIAPRLTSISGQADGSTSPDPAAFAGDPRLARCSQELIDVEKVFEMTKARYFPLYFPGWWQGDPELEVDDPALVVIEHPREWPTTGAAPMPGQTRDSTPHFDYQMCIAVGTPGNFIVHKYGPTHFDRIVPALSADDLARAQHMDPDVLADPANYPVPARLAACGGITDQVQYVFEARSISDYTRYFPAAGPLPVVTADEMATIVVYRGRNPSQYGRLGSPAPNEHDLCILLGPDPEHVPAVFINGVDLTGFHVRLDEPAVSEAPPTPVIAVPSFTPEPAPGGVLPVWLDGNGKPVPTTILSEEPGPAHCGWESTTWLRLDGNLYLRDPKGVLASSEAVPFDPNAALPPEARDTGYHQGGRQIWRTAGPQADPSQIYVVKDGGVELWPAAMHPDELGCA